MPPIDWQTIDWQIQHLTLTLPRSQQARAKAIIRAFCQHLTMQTASRQALQALSRPIQVDLAQLSLPALPVTSAMPSGVIGKRLAEAVIKAIAGQLASHKVHKVSRMKAGRNREAQPHPASRYLPASTPTLQRLNRRRNR